ncbi:MAG: hypothetical protein SH868_16615 [Bythopirellula sp.]|nr:hypothetical protein [Bythopirellula sp.]
MKLPSGERAFVDRQKLFAYSLDPEHDEGRHKAHLFESLLGINLQNGELLLSAVGQAAMSGEANFGKLDKYGQRYVIDFDFAGPGGAAMIRSAWIVRLGEDFPRLVTCFIL